MVILITKNSKDKLFVDVLNFTTEAYVEAAWTVITTTAWPTTTAPDIPTTTDAPE